MTEEQKIYLRGKRYHAEKKLEKNPTGRNQHSEVSGQNEHKPRTAEKLGQQYGVSPITLTSPARLADNAGVTN